MTWDQEGPPFCEETRDGRARKPTDQVPPTKGELQAVRRMIEDAIELTAAALRRDIRIARWMLGALVALVGVVIVLLAIHAAA